MGQITPGRAKGAAALADRVEESVRRGELQPGQRLPSIRALATQHGISPGTAASAIAELRARGVVVTRERSRSYVSWRPPVSLPRHPVVPAHLRNLAYGNPDPALLPDLGAALRRLEPQCQLYGGERVSLRLRKLAAKEFAATKIPADHITVTNGGLDAIERALSVHLQPGDLVAVEDPGFASLLHLVRALGLALRPVAIDEHGLKPYALAEALDEGVRAVIATPRGQNPAGACFDRERAESLGQVLSRHPGVLWIEDDHLGPVSSAPRLTATGTTERWLATRSVSKSLGPDLRLAVVAGDEQTVSRVEGRVAVGPQWVSHLLQELVCEMWADRAVQKRLVRVARTYDERRQQLVRALAAHGVEVSAPSGLNVWVPVPEETAVVQLLAARGWAVAPGAPFRLSSPPAIRVTVSAIGEEESETFARDLTEALAPSTHAGWA